MGQIYHCLKAFANRTPLDTFITKDDSAIQRRLEKMGTFREYENHAFTEYSLSVGEDTETIIVNYDIQCADSNVTTPYTMIKDVCILKSTIAMVHMNLNPIPFAGPKGISIIHLPHHWSNKMMPNTALNYFIRNCSLFCDIYEQANPNFTQIPKRDILNSREFWGYRRLTRFFGTGVLFDGYDTKIVDIFNDQMRALKGDGIMYDEANQLFCDGINTMGRFVTWIDKLKS